MQIRHVSDHEIRTSRRPQCVGVLPVLGLTALTSCAEPEPQVGSVSEAPQTILELGDTIAVYPPPGGPLLARVRELALAADGQSVYVLDRGFAQVHRIGLDGTHLATFGGEGEGPGELELPSSMRPTAGGVWVLDRHRLTLFMDDGTVAETRPMTDMPALTFAPLGDGMVLVPSVQVATQPRPDRLFAEIEGLLMRVEGDGPVVVTNSTDVPDALAKAGVEERWLGWILAPLGDREVAVLLNGPVLRGWLAAASDDGATIESLTELPMPATVVRAIADAIRMADIPEATIRPLRDAKLMADRLWVASTGLGSGPVAFTVPLQDDDPSFVIPGGEGFHTRGNLVRDVVVLPDRVFVARDIAVTIRRVVGPVVN